MSNTRTAADEAFHQEKFCSAEEFSKGILANLVAKRCELIDDDNERELIWFLQSLSHHGGLGTVAAALVKQFPSRVSKAAPQNPWDSQRNRLAKQARIAAQLRSLRDGTEAPEDRDTAQAQRVIEPETAQRVAALELSVLLARICTDPSTSINRDPWYFTGLAESLRQYMSEWEARERKGKVVTSIGRAVEDELDYALHSSVMVLIEGESRTGKSWAAKAWCDARPGRARYVQVPSSTDSICFFRAIATAIGSASGLSMKDRQLRERIEATLKESKLMLVLDEAHYCWPQFCRNETRPARINWLMTELVNSGVPLVLLATPQFSSNRKLHEEKTGWTSEQFIGRIGRYKKLSASLSVKELSEVSRYWLQEGDEASMKALALYANASPKHVAAIEPTVKRARFLAMKDGDKRVAFKHVREAIAENAPPLEVPAAKPRVTTLSISPPADRGDQEPVAANRVSQQIEQEA
jgi:AAA domain-containing protein